MHAVLCSVILAFSSHKPDACYFWSWCVALDRRPLIAADSASHAQLMRVFCIGAIPSPAHICFYPFQRKEDKVPSFACCAPSGCKQPSFLTRPPADNSSCHGTSPLSSCDPAPAAAAVAVAASAAAAAAVQDPQVLFLISSLAAPCSALGPFACLLLFLIVRLPARSLTAVATPALLRTFHSAPGSPTSGLLLAHTWATGSLPCQLVARKGQLLAVCGSGGHSAHGRAANVPGAVERDHE
eukprot:1151471-Pelagomonas_calceolata.AAC.3